MAWVLSLAAIVPIAVACPGEQSAGPTDQAISDDAVEAAALSIPTRQTVNYPPMVLDYIQSTLRDPATHDHASLGQAWEIIARLRDASPFSGVISQQMTQTGDAAPVELVAAWLAADPQPASDWLLVQLAQGKPTYFAALQFQPDLGREILARQDFTGAGREVTEPLLSLLRAWEPPQTSDAELLAQLARSDEPRTKLRAIGYLLALHKSSEDHLATLKEALRSDQINVLASAAEACRISRSEELAQVLVNPAALIPMGDEPGEAESQPDSTGLYTAYALSYLPGEQARLLRSKLLGAADVRIRWQARLGELLHGNIQPWYDAVMATTPEDPHMWLALQPQNLADPALLLTYKRALDSKDAPVRLQVAHHLNRYGAYASERLVDELVRKLLDDDVDTVAAQGWHSAALLRLPGLGNRAQQTLDDAEQAPAIRLAAAFYQLRLAEPAAAADASSARGDAG